MALCAVANLLWRATRCTELVWHDVSLAQVSRRLGQELRRHVAATSAAEAPQGTNTKLGDTLCPPDSDRDAQTPSAAPSSRLVHYGSCRRKDASSYFFPSVDSPRNNLPVIFPRRDGSPRTVARIRRSVQCQCGMLLLGECLRRVWKALSHFFATARHVTAVSLRGIIFDETAALFETHRGDGAWALPQLRHLECSMPILTLVQCPALRVLHTNGSEDDLRTFFGTLRLASPTLEHVTLSVATPQDRQSSYGRNSGASRVDGVCPRVKAFVLTWGGSIQGLIALLNDVTFPSLEYLHIEQLASAHGTQRRSSSVFAQKLYHALVRFIQRSGGTAGTLRCLGIQSKYLDATLQSLRETSSLPCVRPLLGLRILNSSAVFLARVFGLNAATICPNLSTWHCWRLRIRPTSEAHAAWEEQPELRTVLCIINSLPSLHRVSLPANISGEVQLDFVTHLHICGSPGATLRRLVFARPCPTLQELSICCCYSVSALHDLVTSAFCNAMLPNLATAGEETETLSCPSGAFCPHVKLVGSPNGPSLDPEGPDAASQEDVQSVYWRYSCKEKTVFDLRSPPPSWAKTLDAI